MAPRYTKITPSLPVTSIEDSIQYYTTVLGFRVAGRDSNNHCWLQLVDDTSVDKYDAAVNVYLRRRGFPNIANDVTFGKINIEIAGGADELEKLAETFKAKDAKGLTDVSIRPWGLKDLALQDLDGNMIIFSQWVAGREKPQNTIRN